MITKQCTRCKIIKPINDFYKKKSNKDGIDSWCKSCYKITNQIYQKNNKDKLDKYKTQHYHEYPAKYLLRRLKYRSKDKNIENTVKLQDIEKALEKCANKNGEYICPILGIVINIGINCGKNNSKDNLISVDRIDNNKGYIPDNIAIMSFRANSIKSNGTAEEHRKIADFMEKHINDNKNE